MATEVQVGGAADPQVVAPRRSHRLRSVATRWALPVLACLVWELWTRMSPSPFVPPLTEIVQRMYENWFSAPLSEGVITDVFWRDAGGSMRRLFGGYLLGSVIGVVLGFVVGLLRRFAGYIDPLIHFFRGIPKSALIPLYVLLLGVGDSMKIALIATAVLFPVFINTVDGVRSVDPVQLDTARIFKVSAKDRLHHVLLPGASPSILAGLRISLAIAFTMLVIAELAASVDGLGYQIKFAQSTFQMHEMWATIFLIGLVGNLLTVVFERIERRVLHWYQTWDG